MLSLLDALLSLAISLVFLTGVYLRHRKRPVGLAGWLLPLAAGLVAGLVPGLADLLDVDLARATFENRHRLGARGLGMGMGQLLTGLYATVATSLVGIWLLPRKEDQASMPWSSLLGVTVLSVAALAVAYTLGTPWLPGSAFAFATGFCVIIIVSHAALMRLSNSEAPRERALTATVLASTAVVGWAVAMQLTSVMHRWSSLSTLRPDFLHKQIEFAWPWVVAPAVTVFLLSLVHFFLRSRTRLSKARPGLGRRLSLAAALVAVVAMGVGWFAHRYDGLATETTYAKRRYSQPLSYLEDVDLPTSTSLLPAAHTPMVKLGQESTVVSRDLFVDGEVAFETGETELPSALEEVAAAKKREDELLGRPFDPLLTIAVDRCLPATRIVDTMVYAQSVPFTKFKLAVTGEEGESHVINTTAPANPDSVVENDSLQYHYVFQLTDDGVRAYFDGKPVPAVDGCPPNGPTLCVRSAPAQDECASKYDWERLRQVVVSEHAQSDEVIFLVVPSADVPWQTAVDLVDALRLKDPSGRWERDNELLSDPVFFVGTELPPYTAGAPVHPDEDPAVTGDPSLPPHHRGGERGPDSRPPTFDISADQ